MQQTEQVLEWQQLLDAVAHEATSSMGAELCHRFPLAEHIEEAQEQQQETSEMVRMLEGDTPLAPLNLPDIRPHLGRTAKGGLLEGLELRDISLVLAISRNTKQWLVRHQATCPIVSKRVAGLEDLFWLEQTIDHCIDPQGQLRETASPALKQLSQKSQSLRQSMRRKLEQLVHSQQHEERLQGQYFAERENRYVIPVKAERQHEIDGIIHDISSSGATVFIEPRNLIDLNNAIKFADLQVAQETRRILLDLSDTVGEHVVPLQGNIQRLAELDGLVAKARFSRKIKGNPIHLNQNHRIHLIQAKHPLLLLTKKHVVANTIQLEQDIHTLIISGPNAGGKTATLKLIGLTALMAKVGLLPPCASNSEMVFFGCVYADIGDSQDLHNDLSSFSGHILSLIVLLEIIQSEYAHSSQTFLILLDEIGNSTDPAEGAALAEAILHRLSQAGCISIVTTHYSSLKTLPYRNPQVRNASQEFDLENLSPTYRLLDGIPGGSSALDIARRLGLETDILQHARELMNQEDQELSQIFQQLQRIYAQLEEDRTHAQIRHQDAQRLYEETLYLREQLNERERDLQQKNRKQWQREFSKAQRQIHNIVETFKKEKMPDQEHTMRRMMNTINDHMKDQLSLERATPLRSPKEGDLVEIDELGTIGMLQEDPVGKKLVLIRVGSQRIRIAPSAIRLATPSSSKTKFQSSIRGLKHEDSSSSRRDFASGGYYQQEYDFRGLRLEDALEKTMAALDQALMEQTKYVKIIHGQGTGVLKTNIRKLCQSSSYTKSYRAGDPVEGGDGVTIIELG